MQKRTSLWQNPNFVKLWLGQTVSKFGSQIGSAAIYYTALLVLAATPEQLGVLGAVGAAPMLLVSLFAGVWADRVRRRPLLIAADVGRAVLVGSIPVAAVLGVLSFGQLLVVAALAGVLNVLFNVADQSFTPSVVQRHELVEANSKLGASESVAEVAGPAAGGALVGLISAPFAATFDAISFLFSAVNLSLVRVDEAKPAPPEQRNVWREIASGLRYLLGNWLLRPLTLFAMSTAFFGNFIGTLYGYYVVTELGLGPQFVGLLVSAGGVGALLAAFIVGPLGRRLPLGRLLVGAVLLSTVIQLTIPLVGGTPLTAFVVLLLGQLIGDIGWAIYGINEISLRQGLVPDSLQGRVNASHSFLSGGVVPFSALTAGLLAGSIGVRATLWIAVGGLILSTLWLILSPVRSLETQPTLADEG